MKTMPQHSFDDSDALLLLAGIGAKELGYRWMERFPRSFELQYQAANGVDEVEKFLHAVRHCYTSLFDDENVSTLNMGYVMQLRSEKFDRETSHLGIARRLRGGETLDAIFPEYAQRKHVLADALAEHDPFHCS